MITYTRRSHNPLKWAVLWALILALALSACGGGDEEKKDTATNTPEEAEITLGLSVSAMNKFFTPLVEGAEEAASPLGVTLVVYGAEDDMDTQAEQVQSLIDQKVDALLINPVDSEGIVSLIEAANEAGIPVLTIDRNAAGGEVVSHIASDNLAGGKMAAEYLAELLGKKGKVVELQGTPGTSAAEARGNGFNEMISQYPDIEVIASEVANFTREGGKTVFARILEENPEIDGVFAHNDEMILGALEAAKEAGRADEIQFVGFDAIDDAVAAIERGEIAATIAQQPAEMGRLGVETAVKVVRGESVPDSIPVDLALIRQ